MRFIKEEQGQVLIMMAGSVLILILFVGLAVDAGMAYITKAKLSKAVDAACLTGMKALPNGQATATTLATHMFNANFGTNPPVPTITFPLDSYGDQQVSVTAAANVPSFFAAHFFPSWKVSDTAVATRGKLVMAIILDRSNSMNGNGGKAALQAAVPTFVNDFDNSLDEVAMISFASDSSVDFSIATNFQTPITNAVKALNFSGGTFGTGGTYVAAHGPPLALADNQIGSVPIQPGQNVTRVAVYFTDGLMNTIQDTFTCYTNHTTAITPLINYGGYDTGSVGFFDPTDGTQWGTYSTGLLYGAGKICQNPCGTYVTKFPSQQYGPRTISQSSIAADAQYRAIQTANTMRAENPGVYVYVIGLGSQISGSSSTQDFLRQLANDPASTSYNPNLPQGLFFIVPDCPSSTCTSELKTAFQTIASKILLRLTQ